MSNEVIIDGVNVAECMELHTKEGYAENCHITNDCCKHNPNCYFKQLQRLKDKSEKISYRFKQTKKANKQYKTDIKNLQAENEKLKEKINSYNCSANCYKYKEAEKYKQALEEIREDMQEYTTCESRECGCNDYAECINCIKETIINKINEVLDEK